MKIKSILNELLSENQSQNIVYHGSYNKFSSFNDSKPIFFVDREEIAKTYGKYVIKAKITLNNPIEIDFEGKSTVYFLNKHFIPSKLAEYVKELSDDLKQYGRLDDDVMEQLENEYQFSDQYGDLDGIIMYNIDDVGNGMFNDSGTQTNYVVFDKSQIQIIK